MYKDIVFIKHEMLVDDLPDGKNPESYAKYVMERYKNEAKLVVSSRFHGAIIPWSLGIPVIVTNETYTFRFSWVKKLLPFYTKDEFSKIDWNPPFVDNSLYKEYTRSVAKERIMDAINKYKDLLIMSEYLENPIDHEGLIDYYDEAIAFIKNKWNKNDTFNYSFWGINNNAKAIHDYIIKNYPNATLTDIYDTFKTVKFAEIVSKHPDEIDSNKNSFIFVTTFVAGYVAERLFEDKNIPHDYFFICKRRYITQYDLLS